MKSRLHYSAEALRDLDEIWDYIVSDLSNPAAAQRTVDKIVDSVERLSDFPEMGAPLISAADVDGDYRFLVCGSYLTFYRAVGNEVYIDRILYGRRDYLRILFGNPAEDE